MKCVPIQFRMGRAISVVVQSISVIDYKRRTKRFGLADDCGKRMPQETQAILCPYCGHTQRKMDRCEACGGSFDPVSRRGVAVNMGPWFLHDERVPFRPGFNYTSMKRLIAAGKVTANSILRGPSTQQLWAPARLTPGIAHLVGRCPRCETPAKPDAPKCTNCEQPFNPETAYNELGLPFASGAQARAAQVELDREVTRSNGRSRSLRLWHHPDVPMLALCPYCGDWQKNTDRCSTCGGVFDQLSQRATIIAMGPWFVRNKRFPYLPGCSYDVMRRQIEAGRIDASTILRGPTTRQFWSIARNVPGVSHLVGFCWSCGAAAKANDARCSSCQSPFGGVDAQNALGMAFASEAEAMAAEQELEAQFNPMMPPTPVAAPPIPVSLKATGAMPGGMNSMTHAAVGQAAFSGLDRASLAVIAAAVVTPQREDRAVAAATLSPVPSVRSRRRVEKKTHPVIFASLLLGIIAGAIGAVVFVANQTSTITKPNELATKDSAVNPPDLNTGKQPTTTTPIETHATDPKLIQEQATKAWAAARDLGREGQVGLVLDNIGDLMARADAMFAEGSKDKSVAVYSEALKEMQTLQVRVMERDEAIAARNGAADLLISLDPTDLPDVGLEMIEQTKMRFDEAQINFDNGEFLAARDIWKSVETGLVTLPERAKGLTIVRSAEQKYVATLDRNLDDAMMQLAGGPAWREVMIHVSQARTATANERWTEAAMHYETAATLAPPIVRAAKPLAVRYWSCLAGQVGARAWAEHIDDSSLDPRLRGIMRPLYLRLGVPFADIDQAMLAPVSKDQVLKLVLVAPAAAVQTSHGEAALQTFQLGVHLVSLSRLLTPEEGKIAGEKQTEIARRLKEMKESVKTAGFNQKMTDQLDSFAEKLADLSEPKNITNAKALCDKLIAQLASAEQAIGMLRD